MFSLHPFLSPQETSSISNVREYLEDTVVLYKKELHVQYTLRSESERYNNDNERCQHREVEESAQLIMTAKLKRQESPQ